MKRLLTCLVLVCAPALALASAGGEHGDYWQLANNDVGNTSSLQRGAKYFVNYCMGCHSLQYVRYSSLIEDLGITETQLQEYLMYTADKSTAMMTNAMPPNDAGRWFGITPPDLTLTARARGTDWIYNYLRAFYLDENQPTGVNNLVLPNASMPHVLAGLQGYQVAHFRAEQDAQGNIHEVFEGFELVVPGKLTAKEYDEVVRDIVNFLDYTSEPVQIERRNIGIGVLTFLLVFFLFAFFLKREYWKDIH